MGDALRQLAENTDGLPDATQNLTAQNPQYNEIALAFRELRVQRPIFNYRTDLAATSVVQYGIANALFHILAPYNFISTRDDVVKMSLAQPVFGAPATLNTAYVPGYPLLALKRVQFRLGSYTLSDVSPQGMYMIGCMSTPPEREELFSLWHIGDDLATRHAAIGANTDVHVPLHKIAPFWSTESFLKSRDLLSRATYAIDIENAARLISLDTATLTSAQLSSMVVSANHPVLAKRDEERIYSTRTQEMWLDCYTSMDFQIPALATQTSVTLSFNSNLVGLMVMVTDEVAPGGDYRPFTGVALTHIGLNVDSRSIPNVTSDSTEYSQFIFNNAVRKMGYANLPAGVYGMLFPFQETPEQDIQSASLRSAEVRSPILTVTMASASHATRRLHVLFFNQRAGSVDATREFRMLTVR